MTENVLSGDMDQFQNPAKLPLEQVDIQVKINGKNKTISALSKYWVAERYFLRYESPKIYNEDGSEITGAKDRWLEIVNYIVKDMDWLLCLPFYKFWSNIVYDSSIIDSIVFFLQECPVFYNLEKFPDDQKMRESLENLRRQVLIFFARIVTNKENSDAFMTPEFHGKLIYDEFLMTTPIMMDLCQLYGRENPKIVGRIIMSALKAQPIYENDFRVSIDYLAQYLSNLELNFEDSSLATTRFSLKILEDLSVNLLDISTNTEIFLRVYPAAADYFCNDSFLIRLVSIYGNIIPEIYKRLLATGYNEENLLKYTELKQYLDVARLDFLKVFRAATFKDIAWILEQPDPRKVNGAKERVDQFLTHLITAVSEKDFFRDYDKFYPVEDDLDLVTQITTEIDSTKKDLVLNSIKKVFNDSQKKTQNRSSVSSNSLIPLETEAGPSGLQNPQPSSSKSSNSQSSNVKSEDELLELMKDVKNILCHLGEGFIEKCLKYYNYNQQSVINAILEDNLPAELRELDQTLPYIPPDPMEKSAAIDKTLGMERLNIYDGDEFDVMTQDKIDTSRVHRGKRKDKYKNMNALLNDKTFKNNLGEVYEKYGLVQDDYDDEYDDTYDSQDIGTRGADDGFDEAARLFTTPRVLRVNDKVEEIEEDDEEEENSGFQQNGRNFCQDPAALRAKAEEKRLMSRRGGHHDVIGRPKGQGNEKEVLVNRDRKNTQKAFRANHNRRSGADRKRRQGLVPS